MMMLGQCTQGRQRTWLLPSSASTLLVPPAHWEASVVFRARLTLPNGMPVAVSNADIMRSAKSCALQAHADCCNP